jgi:hypothetical protein
MAKVGLNIPFRRALEQYLKRVLKAVKPRAIILYGSTAKGTYGAGSDIDLIVISEHLHKRFLNRLKLLLELNNTPAPIEALGYTPDEFLKMVSKTHPTALSALEEGIPLHDDGFLTEAKELLAEVKRKRRLVKVEDGWETEP